MTTQADGIHSDEPTERDEVGGCSCGARFYSFEAADNHADECPLPDDRDLPADTIASHLRNLQQLIELRTQHAEATVLGGRFASSTVLFVGEELDAVNARIAKALALAEQQDVRQIEMLRRALEEITWGKGPYSVDELTFAGNVVERGKDIARRALAGTYSCELAEQVTT